MVKTHSEAVSAIDEAELVSTLRSAIRGEVIGRGHPSYDRARHVWNGMIDRRPAVITRCADTADVVETVRIARRYRPIVSIRAGGHQVAGSAVCDDGLVIDLSAMKRIHVDATGRKVRAQGGVTWGELDRETQRHGLATTGGEVSTTGIAGFTLGGGMGVLMRAHGLACDNLRSIEIVTADGVVRTASRDENPDILWAARGGGRGIGVVTTFEFDLHPVGPDVAFAQVVYPYEEAGRILRAWSDAALSAPETVTPQIILWTIPADPAFAPELHNADVAIVIGVYAGPPAESERALAPLRRLGTPLLDMSDTAPYVAIQSSFDEVFPAGGRYYMKSHFMDELTDPAVDTLLDWDRRKRDPGTIVVLRTMGGAVGRVGPDESAFAHRSAAFNLSIDTGWHDPAMDDEIIGWSRAAWDAMKPFSTGGVYVNFSGLGDEADVLRGAVYGESQRRLAEVRSACDPEGLFSAAARLP